MLRTRVIALVSTGALAAGGVALLVPTSADAATQAAQGKGLTAAQKAELKKDGHLEVTRKGKTVDIQRGDILAVTPSSITLKSVDGYTHTYVVDKKSKVTGGGFATVGEKARVIAIKDDARRLTYGPLKHHKKKAQKS